MPDLVHNEPTARLNVTYAGQNGDLPDPVQFDATEANIKHVAEESLRDGYIPGIEPIADVDLSDFVVDRFPATDDLPPRIMIRPKVPFGG